VTTTGSRRTPAPSFTHAGSRSIPKRRAVRAQEIEWAERGFWIWDRDETQKYFLAGAGAESRLRSALGRGLAQDRGGAPGRDGAPRGRRAAIPDRGAEGGL